MQQVINRNIRILLYGKYLTQMLEVTNIIDTFVWLNIKITLQF